MKRPAAKEYNDYYGKYINTVTGKNFSEMFDVNLNNTIKFFTNITETESEYRYEKNKWTIKEILVHLIQKESGMNSLVREATNQQTLSSESGFSYEKTDKKSIADLIKDLKSVRTLSKETYNLLTEKDLNLFLEIPVRPLSIRASGYVIIGHINHHIEIIKQKYLRDPNLDI